MGRYPRTSPLYWLVDIEGVDAKTAARIVAIYDRGEDPLPHFPSDAAKIQAAYDGLYCVLEDC